MKKEQLENLEEFGYGFYIRYLSQYPVQMRVGKTAPWYRIARLSKTDKYGDGGVGDRILANWMGIDGYSFVSCISGGAPYTMVAYPQVEG